MSHCLRKCQAQVPIQMLIEHSFYSSSSYINVYFSFIVDVFHLFQVSFLGMMTVLCHGLSFAVCYVKLKFYFAKQKRRYICKYVMVLCYSSHDFISSVQLAIKIMFIYNVFLPFQGQHCLDKIHSYLPKFKMVHHKKNWKFKEGKFKSCYLQFFFSTAEGPRASGYRKQIMSSQPFKSHLAYKMTFTSQSLIFIVVID